MMLAAELNFLEKRYINRIELLISDITAIDNSFEENLNICLNNFKESFKKINLQDDIDLQFRCLINLVNSFRITLTSFALYDREYRYNIIEKHFNYIGLTLDKNLYVPAIKLRNEYLFNGYIKQGNDIMPINS